MKKRYLYALLFGVPGFFIAGICSLFLFGGLMGMLWLFILGDNPWPPLAPTGLAILALLVFLMGWISLIGLGYRLGRQLESDPAVNRGHILLSVGLTAAFILFIILQQWSAGNLGPKSGGMLCSDYCISQGYSMSGTPPADSGERTCTCYADSGVPVLTVPLDQNFVNPAK